MVDIEVVKMVFQVVFHRFHRVERVDDDVGGEGVVGRGNRPNVQVVDIADVLVFQQRIFYLFQGNVLRKSVEREAQTARQQVPRRNEDDGGDDEADDGIDDGPARRGDDDARNDDSDADEPVQTITLKRLLELLTHGNVNDDYMRLIAAKLARIYNKCTDKQREEFQRLAYSGMQEISAAIFDALEKNELPPYESIDEPNLERKGLVAPLTHHPEARQYLLILAAGFIETLMPGEDQLISKGFSEEEAKEVTSAFEKYCDEHQDEIEALRMIYNNDGEPLTYATLKDLENKLKLANNKFQTSRLWNCYTIVSSQSVKKHSTKEEKEALTNIIQLVRFANHQIETLESLYPSAQQRFNLWYGQVQRTVTESQITIIRQIVDYIASNGACTIKDIIDDDKTRAAQLIKAFGGKPQADEALASLSKFLLYRKTA